MGLAHTHARKVTNYNKVLKNIVLSSSIVRLWSSKILSFLSFVVNYINSSVSSCPLVWTNSLHSLLSPLHASLFCGPSIFFGLWECISFSSPVVGKLMFPLYALFKYRKCTWSEYPFQVMLPPSQRERLFLEYFVWNCSLSFTTFCEPVLLKVAS